MLVLVGLYGLLFGSSVGAQRGAFILLIMIPTTYYIRQHVKWHGCLVLLAALIMASVVGDILFAMLALLL